MIVLFIITVSLGVMAGSLDLFVRTRPPGPVSIVVRVFCGAAFIAGLLTIAAVVMEVMTELGEALLFF